MARLHKRHSWQWSLGSKRAGHTRTHGNYVGKNTPRSSRSFNYYYTKTKHYPTHPNNSPGDV